MLFRSDKSPFGPLESQYVEVSLAGETDKGVQTYYGL